MRIAIPATLWASLIVGCYEAPIGLPGNTPIESVPTASKPTVAGRQWTPPWEHGGTFAAVVPEEPEPPLPQVHTAAPLGTSRMQRVLLQGTQPGRDAVGFVVATDPDHDALQLVPFFSSFSRTATQLTFAAGSRPGDVATGPSVVGSFVDSMIYVSLHGAGAVAVISGEETARTSAPTYELLNMCDQPRGLDTYPRGEGSYSDLFSAPDPYLFVACAEGVLIKYDPDLRQVISRIPLADDLKDVVVLDPHTALVTRFRSAEVFQVNLDTGAATQIPLPVVDGREPDVAWQLLPLGTEFPRNGALLAHQYASTQLIRIAGGGTIPEHPDVGPLDGGVDNCSICRCADGSCPIDSQGSCEGGDNCMHCVVHDDYGPPPSDCFTSALPTLPPQANLTPLWLLPTTEPVECPASVVASAMTLLKRPPNAPAGAIAQASLLAVLPDLAAPLSASTLGDDRSVVVLGIGSGRAVQINSDTLQNGPCLFSSPSLQSLTGVVAAVPDIRSVGTLATFLPQNGAGNGRLSGPTWFTSTEFSEVQGAIGRNLFHQATAAQISCASCHPGGRDDGHIWNFDPIGARRTPSLGGGLLATAPFHWDGAEFNLSQLMNDVFVDRMHGSPPSVLDVERLGEWMDALPVPREAVRPTDAEAIAKGKALFDSYEVGCANCHYGEHFTDNESHNVGTGGSFQSPSLLGVAARAPFLHDGRAVTLKDRFGPAGGGDQHGRTSQLSEVEIDQLVAYLRTL